MVYSQISPLSGHHQRDFFWQQMGVDTETHSHTVCGKCLHWGSPLGPSPLKLRGAGRRGSGRIVKSQRGWNAPGEGEPLNHLIRAQRLAETEAACTALHQILWLWLLAWRFPGTPDCGNRCALAFLFGLLLGLFSCCWFALTCLNRRTFALSSCLLCRVWLSLGGLFFSKRRLRGRHWGRRELGVEKGKMWLGYCV